MVNERNWVVIMAGGIGERFWPLSTPTRPKQLLPFGANGKLLIEDAFQRGLEITNRDAIWIATTEELKEAFAKLNIVPSDQIVCEPCRRNTAGCIVYVVAQYLARYDEFAQDTVMAVLTADQRIEPLSEFTRAVQAIIRTVREREVLGIIGIKPVRPETGYGYIEFAKEPITRMNEIELFPVVRFHEKPDARKAELYIQSGNFYWNSGMFFWKISTFLNELKVASPVHYEAIFALKEWIRLGKEQKIFEEFSKLPNLSIDYALMEKTRNVVMAKAHFYWDDLGSWASIERVFQPDKENDNIIHGDVLTLETRNSVIYNNSSRNQVVATLGINNLVIAVTDDVILVMEKGREQDVKRLRERYNDKNK